MEEGTIVDAIKIVDFQSGNASVSVPVDIYAPDFWGWEVDLSVAVSDTRNVAALLRQRSMWMMLAGWYLSAIAEGKLPPVVARFVLGIVSLWRRPTSAVTTV